MLPIMGTIHAAARTYMIQSWARQVVADDATSTDSSLFGIV